MIKNTMTFILTMLLLVNSAWAELPDIFLNLDEKLEKLTVAREGQTTLTEMKEKSVDQNIGLDIAYENYFKAKREVNIARAAFNPLTTGYALGLSLGMNYLWEMIAVEAVLSIPTKFYNVKNKKYIKRAEFYNYLELQEVIKNDMAHLYYDILIHEMILNTIQIETELILSFYEGNTTESDFLRKRLAVLNIERIDIEMLYVKELEAFRNLLAITFNTDADQLAPVTTKVTASQVASFDPEKILNKSVYNNPKYLAATNMTLAAKAGVKSVKWSVITFSGMNFSYFKRVKVAKSSYRQAQLQEISTARKLKVNYLGSYEKLLSSSRLADHYNSIYTTTLGLYREIVDNNRFSLMSDEAVLGVSLDLLRDYRDHILANYKVLSALDDFSKASSHQITLRDDGISAEENRNPRLALADKLTAEDFEIERVGNNFGDESSDIVVKVNSDYNDLISSVTYKFDDSMLRTRKVTSGKYGFRSHQFNIFGTINRLDGEAVVVLKNDKTLTIRFELY